jgi:hypothetical protein
MQRYQMNQKKIMNEAKRMPPPGIQQNVDETIAAIAAG